jgi:phosphoglycolate phosphatase-like HAD superfamily hydrolase
MTSIIKANTLCEVYDDLLPEDHQSWLLLDVDGTLIHPKDSVFRAPKELNPFPEIIDDFKNQAKKSGPEQTQLFQQFLGAFRLHRDVELVDPLWLEILKQYQESEQTVLALTKMDTGSFGSIESVEEWRLTELNNLGVSFYPNTPRDKAEILIEEKHVNAATLYQGALFTGGHSKSQTLDALIQRRNTKPEKIRFVDDRLEQILDLQTYCESQNILFKGFHFLQASNLPHSYCGQRAALQKQTFVEEGIWLSDEKADQKLKK